jgi:hypothetical protein
LAQAKSVDEAKQIRDGAAALRAYAKQAKNRQLEIDAVEIRVRAERRVGELLAQQKVTVGLNEGGKRPKGSRGTQGRISSSHEEPLLKKPTLAEAGIDKKLSSRGQQLAAVPPDQFEALLDDWRDRVQHPKARVTSNVHFSSETPEHYTPQTFLNAVGQVFGGIPDLDPCSNSHGKPNVQARTHYTSADDGLTRPWHGRVFLNPPYGREIAAWIEKLRAEWRREEVTEVIALLPARTDTAWFEALTAETDDPVVCFLRGRLVFVGSRDPAPFPSMAVYFGPHHDRFADVFLELGSLWQRPACPLEWFVKHD